MMIVMLTQGDDESESSHQYSSKERVAKGVKISTGTFLGQKLIIIRDNKRGMGYHFNHKVYLGQS